MAQSDLVKVTGGIVLGVAMAAVLGIGVFGVNVWGDRETEVLLSADNDGRECMLTKAMLVRGAETGHHVIWEIENYCPVEATIMLGNFRVDSKPSTQTDCSVAGTANQYPFTDDRPAERSETLRPAQTQKDGSIKPSKGKITLKVKSRNELGEAGLTYYFDMCLGGVKKDPKLMIER